MFSITYLRKISLKFKVFSRLRFFCRLCNETSENSVDKMYICIIKIKIPYEKSIFYIGIFCRAE